MIWTSRLFTSNLWYLVLLLAIPLFTNEGRAGETVRWRTDYNAARKEATEKARPLFLDFGTEDCFHCRRLDASTFRDPTIVSLLNERFVPLKIDGNREPALVQMLRINAYPTLILASSDGKILGVIEGYMEAPRLLEQLQRALATSAPDWMVRDFHEASKSIAAADYARAVSLLKNIVEDGKDRPVQLKARQVLLDIEQQATARLAKVKQMEDQGQSAEALDQLTNLLKNYAGTQAAAEGAKLLTSLADKPAVRESQRQLRARELLALAREEYRRSDYGRCLEHCETLIAAYKDLPEGKEGDSLATEIQNSPEKMAIVCDHLNERLAKHYTTLADTWMKKGQPLQAQLCLEKVLKHSPNSPQAQLAQVRLAQLQGKPATQQATFQKE